MQKVPKAASITPKVRNRRKLVVNGQRMRRPDGQFVRLVPIDPHTPSFDDDLTMVFQRNIARTRHENNKLFGSPDGPSGRK